MTTEKMTRRGVLFGLASLLAASAAGCSSTTTTAGIGETRRLPTQDKATSTCWENFNNLSSTSAKDACAAEVYPELYQRPGNVPAPQTIDYRGNQPPGTIIVNNDAKKLYFVQGGGKAIAFAIAIGDQGATIKPGRVMRINRRAPWPRWTPTRSHPELEGHPEWHSTGKGTGYVDGGPWNPMGARALYMVNERGVDEYYRIHGTTVTGSINTAASLGCIRMMNDDVKKLYDMVPDGAKVMFIDNTMAEARMVAGLPQTPGLNPKAFA